MTAWSNRLRDTDVLWTRSSFPNQTDPGGNGSGFAGLEAAHQAWEWNWPPTGVHVRKKVSGTVLTSTGVPVSGASGVVVQHRDRPPGRYADDGGGRQLHLW